MKLLSIAPLAALLYGSVALRPVDASPDWLPGHASIAGFVARSARAADIAVEPAQFEYSSNFRIPSYYLYAPACAAPTLIVPVRYSAFENIRHVSITLALRYPHMKQNVFHANRSWQSFGRIALPWARIEIAVRSWAGWTDMSPAKLVIVAASPPGCAAAQTLDWSGLWKRGAQTSIAGAVP